MEDSSVQGMGDQALGLARAYGDMDLLAIPAAAASFLVAPVLLLGLLSDGVATLPSHAISVALVAGLAAPALVRPSPVEGAGVEPATS